jgi:hypothetical protein
MHMIKAAPYPRVAKFNRMKRAITYRRRASGAQGDRLSGLHAQTNTIRRYANENGASSVGFSLRGLQAHAHTE